MGSVANFIIPVQIEQEEIPCFFRYSERAKYLQLRITRHRKLEVVIPLGVKSIEAEKFFNSRLPWIKDRYSKLKKLQEKPLLFGNELEIVHSKTAEDKFHNFKYEGNSELIITSPKNSKTDKLKLYEWYIQKYAKVFLPKRLQELGERFGFSFNRVTVRNQATKWGSCSSKKNINLNYKLIKLPERLIDYIIIHELCHLIHLNHSKKYWREVAKILPDYQKLERELKKYKM
jgi:hypothetical protein